MTDLLDEYTQKIETLTAEAWFWKPSATGNKRDRDVLVAKLQKLTGKALTEGLTPSKETEKALKQADRDLKKADKEFADEQISFGNDKVVKYAISKVASNG